MNRTAIIALVVLLCVSVQSMKAAEPGPNAARALSPPDIFHSTNIWDVHLRFTPEQWEAMEPKQQGRPQFGGRRGSFLQGPEGGRNGIASALGWEFPEVHADLEFGPHSFKDVAVRYKGNGTFLSSQDSLKRSFKIDLNDFVKGQKLAGMSQVNLHNSVRDPSHMNEALGYQLYREAGIPAPRTSYAKVHVTVPGRHDRQYFGLYNLVEDVGSSFVEEHFDSKDGALLKPVTPNLFSDLGDDWSAYNQTYDPKGKLSDEQKQRLIETCKFFTKATEAEFAAGVGDHIDLDNFARYVAMTVWLSDMDGILGPGQNYYFYLHPTTRKFLFIPWDQDQSFGQYPRGSQEQREQLSIHKPWNEGNAFFEKMFKVEAFQTRYLAALKAINESVVQPDRINRQVEELANVLRAPVGEESADRLAELNKAAAGEMITTLMTGGRSWLVETKPIKLFVPLRQASITEQLAGRSQGETTDRGSGRGR
jgi:spore coat protein H